MTKYNFTTIKVSRKQRRELRHIEKTENIKGGMEGVIAKLLDYWNYGVKI